MALTHSLSLLLSLLLPLALSSQLPHRHHMPALHLAPPSPPFSCPCSDASLCETLQVPDRRELAAYQVSQDYWQQYSWDKLTTIVMFDGLDPDLLCYAHARKVRLVWGTYFPTNMLGNETYREIYIYNWIQKVKETATDGINLDIEDPMDDNSPEKQYYTQFVQEMTTAFHTEIPGTQVTIDVAWSPDCIDLRCYDYAGLSLASDFLMIMGYDLRSQIFEGPCIAGANAPLNQIGAGIAAFIAKGCPPSRLVLGVPWYGYTYTCVDPQNYTVCPIASVPFRGVACSDAAGGQYQYSDMMKLLNRTTADGTGTGRQFSYNGDFSPWFTYKDANTSTVYQQWYDDPESLAGKYALSLSIRGVVMWFADALDYSGEEPGLSQTKEMWDTLNEFF